MYRKNLVSWVLLFLLLLSGCVKIPAPVDESHAATLSATVSILPQRYFVERIGGAHVAVTVMVQPGESPATYEPEPAQLVALNAADLYFSIGVPFERAWLTKFAATNPEMLVVDTAEGIERRPISRDATETSGENLDPHIWLSPALVKVQAQNIYRALVQLDPEREVEYQANLDAFLADIEVLQAEIQATLQDSTGERFMVFHPSWGYFADEFGLQQLPIESGGQEPSAQELAGIIATAQAEGIRVIFAQPEFSTKAAEMIAQEIGGKVQLISPLALDWLANMRRATIAFAESSQ
ncbi:MAG: zinc ABC transporter substrate-binding protein [Chloroflexota bacterium]|nr:zinc ABC transporter substrate-binding protein [Chloroflexota bacterium]